MGYVSRSLAIRRTNRPFTVQGMTDNMLSRWNVSRFSHPRTRAWVLVAWVIPLSLFLQPRAADAQLPPPPYGKRWVLAWSEDFDGTALDESKWNHRSEAFRGDRSHNGHRIKWRYEHDNVSIANSHLVLRNTRQLGDEYDLVKAAAIDTKGKFEQTYGYFEASIRIAPTGDGVHTAFWLQNDNRNKKASNGGVDGPSDGAEIDILESVYTTDRYAMAVHWDGGRSLVEEAEFPPIHGGQFHVYGLAWTPDSYTFYADGQRKEQMFDAVSHSDGYVILSTGVSWFAGNAHTGTFPNEALVDWVRVYQLVDAPSITVTGSANVGRTLIASATGIHDQDGLTIPTFQWQWLVSDGDGDSFAEIAGATGTEYTIRPSDQGKSLKVRAIYTDDTQQTVYSEPLLVTEPPIITSTGPFTVYEGETAVAALTATDGDTPVQDLVWSIEGGVDADHLTFTEGSALAFRTAKDFETPDDTDRDGSYEVVVQVGDGANTVGDTLTVTLADVDEEGGPELKSASKDGNALLLVFDEILDASSTPAPGAFAVTVNEISRGIESVRLERNIVWLTLTGSALAWGNSVTASYTVPSSNPLRDIAGNPAASATIETLLRPLLTASFESVPNTHDGAPFVLRVRFSEAVSVSWTAMRDRLLRVTNGRVTRARRHGNDGDKQWEITIEPSGGDVTVQLPATTDCEAEDAVCTEDGRSMMEAVTATIAERTVPPLTAAFAEAPKEHDGSEDFTVRLNFTGPVNVTETAMRTKVLSVTWGRIRSAEHELGRRDRWLLTIAPTSIEDVVLVLAPLAASCGDADAVCAPDGRKLSSGAEVRVTGPANIPLTAHWQTYVGRHDGTKVFTLNAEFSWPVATSREAMYQQAVRVTNGEATNAFPKRNQPKIWVFRIKPLYNETIRVELLPTTDCTAEGAICTEDGRPLTNRVLWDIMPRDPNAVDETAPELLRAEVDGAHLLLLYREGLDETSTPAVEAFTVTVGGQPRSLAASNPVAVDGRRVRLTLTSAVAHGDTVTVRYSVPTENPIQDRAGNAAAALNDQAVTNHTPEGDTTAPELEEATASTDSVVLTYSEALDETSTPVAAAFAVTVADQAQSLAETDPVVVSGSTVTLTFASAVAAGQPVTVRYTILLTNPLQDPSGNLAASTTITTRVPEAQRVPGEPVTATFESVPTHHAETAFTFRLAFSEEFPVDAAVLRDSALDVTNGQVTGAEQVEEGKSQTWTITVEPSSQAEVTIALQPKESCTETGALCTEDDRGLAEAVSATVLGPKPVPYVTEVSVTSDPGSNGVWDTGETVVAEVRFSGPVAVTGPVGVGPMLGILLDGTRREADYTGGSGSALLRFSYAVTAADAGARKARVAANGLSLNGTVLGDNNDQEAELDFATVPYVTGVELVADASGDGIWTHGETIEVRVAFNEAVSFKGGAATLGITIAGGPAILGLASGSGSATLVFVHEVADEQARHTQIGITANSLGASGGTIASRASGLVADLSHGGTEPTAEPEEEDPPESNTVVLEPEEPRGSRDIGTITLTADTPGTIQAAWEEPTETPANYRIAWAKVGENFLTWTDPSGNAYPTEPSYTITGLEAGEEYKVKMRASYNGTAGGWSGQATITVAESPPDNQPAVPLTARFENMPASHDESAFTFALRFSEEFSLSYTTLQDHALEVTNGELTGVGRQETGKNQAWNVTVVPDGDEDVTITLVATTDCTATGAVCTGDNRPLSAAVSATVVGPEDDEPPVNNPPPSNTVVLEPEEPRGARDIGTITLTAATPATIQASWEAPSESPADYRIMWAKVDESFKTWTDNTGNAYPTEPSYAITGLEAGEEYKVKIRARYNGTAGDWSGQATITVVESQSSKPIVPSLTFGLEANYPNPFNPETHIAYRLSTSGAVELAIYNILGQRIRTLVQEVQSAGRYRVVWNGRNDNGAPVASGIYLYRLSSAQEVQVRRLLLLK